MSDLPHRTSSLAWQIGQRLQRLSEWSEYQFSRLDIDGPNLPTWPWLEPLGRVLFWLTVATLILWMGWLLYRGLMAYLHRRHQRRGVTQQSTSAEVALKQVADWWRQAQRLAQAGDYAGACTALYMAALIRLNDADLVPYQVSRTDGEYLDCITAQPSRPYELLIRTHERLTFGSALATEETYQRCRRAYQEIAQP
jgi:hypothetical protein